MKSELRIKAVEFYEDCSGCGERIKRGEMMLTNIASCCGGGCVRSICIDCLKFAYVEMEKENGTKRNKI